MEINLYHLFVLCTTKKQPSKNTINNFPHHSCACSGDEVEKDCSIATHHQIAVALEAQVLLHHSQVENCIHPPF